MTIAVCEKPSTRKPVSRLRWEMVNCNLCGRDDYEPYHQERLAYFGRQFDFKIVRCCHCGLVYTNPRLVDHNATYMWGSSADSLEIERHAQAKALIFKKGLKEIKRQQKRQGRAPGGTLLDVGCGSGHFLGLAREVGFKVCGIEPVEVLADYAIDTFGAPVQCEEVLKAQLPFEGFDVITAWDVLEHVADPYAVLRRCGQWLRPGGIMALRFPSASWQKIKGVVLHDWLSSKWPAFGATMHLYFFSEGTFERLARRAGLEVLRFRTTAIESNTNSLVGDCAKALSHLTLRGLEIVSRKRWGNLEVYCRKAHS
ncbi:class I SAM-dependent methyltransferase [Planctomycetota bacterium]